MRISSYPFRGETQKFSRLGSPPVNSAEIVKSSTFLPTKAKIIGGGAAAALAMTPMLAQAAEPHHVLSTHAAQFIDFALDTLTSGSPVWASAKSGAAILGGLGLVGGLVAGGLPNNKGAGGAALGLGIVAVVIGGAMGAGIGLLRGA